jgi:hypothetical protein
VCMVIVSLHLATICLSDLSRFELVLFNIVMKDITRYKQVHVRSHVTEILRRICTLFVFV